MFFMLDSPNEINWIQIDNIIRTQEWDIISFESNELKYLSYTLSWIWIWRYLKILKMVKRSWRLLRILKQLDEESTSNGNFVSISFNLSRLYESIYRG